MFALDGATKGGGVVRLAKILTVDSWSTSVIVATVAAVAAMAGTAVVSVLASDEVTLSAPVYGKSATVRSGKRCERAVFDPRLAEPFPDACVVQEATGESAALRTIGEPLRELYRLRVMRPLEEVVEIPEDFI